MKKLIALLLVAVTCLSFVACNNSSTTDDNATTDSNLQDNQSGNNSQDNESNEKFSVDLEGYVANIGNATALGIAQKPNGNVAPVMAKGGIELLSFVKVSSKENAESKNYIVMSTTEYGANTPEADKNGLTKVTFTKTVTENVTTEVTGTKYITASEGQINILAVTGFTYTIYENETMLHKIVQDNDETDTNDQEGVIVLTGLTDGTEYKVDYTGIGEEITITQDEINGEIDKLYSAGGYTFISFVPEGKVQRPTGDDITYDYTGIALYDKYDYTSNSERQSFVIDNTTGLVYALDGFSIDRIENGVIISSDKHFDMEAQENGELKFTQIVQNETLTVYGVFKDKYGTKYVHNDYLEGYDEANKTLYHKKAEYFLSDKGVAIYIEVDEMYSDVIDSRLDDIPKIYTAIQRIDENLEKNSISDAESYRFALVPGYIKEIDKIRHMYIENGYAYVYVSTGGRFSRTTLSTMKTECNFEGLIPYDYNTVLIVIEGTLYYGDLWGSNAYQPGSTNNLVLLAPNCELVPETKDKGIENVRYRYTTFTETIFYKIISDNNGNPKAVSETYVAPEREVITLQPIN